MLGNHEKRTFSFKPHANSSSTGHRQLPITYLGLQYLGTIGVLGYSDWCSSYCLSDNAIPILEWLGR